MNRATTARHNAFYYSKLKATGLEGEFSVEPWKILPS